jgi:hypothetical protein
LLKAAAAGHVGEDLCCAVSAVVSGKPDQAVAAIRKIGHSSGWDMMVGILTALHVATTRDARPSRNAAFLQRQEGRTQCPTDRMRDAHAEYHTLTKEIAELRFGP